jgi:hypothetical protein
MPTISLLTHTELTRLRLGLGVQVVFTLVLLAGLLALGQNAASIHTWDEGLFLALVMLVCALATAFFAHLSRRTLGDLRRGEKIILQGVVKRVERRSTSYGPAWQVWVDDMPFSEPLFATRVQLHPGLPVRVAYLPGSGRCLSIEPR